MHVPVAVLSFVGTVVLRLVDHWGIITMQRVQTVAVLGQSVLPVMVNVL